MKVRYKEEPYMYGRSSELTSDSPGNVEVTFSDGNLKARSVPIGELEVRLSRGWKDMDEAFRYGDVVVDDHTARFVEPRAREVAIPASTIAASLQDVQAAAARVAEIMPWVRANAENTVTGVILRGSWLELGAGDHVAGTWSAAYEVEETEAGKNAISGTFAVARTGRADLVRTDLVVAASSYMRGVRGYAEHIARKRSAEVERPPVHGPARLPHTEKVEFLPRERQAGPREHGGGRHL